VDDRIGQLGATVLLTLTVAACPSSEPAAILPDAVQVPAIDEAPASFGGRIPSPMRNPLSEAGVALGRRLFYDASLSADGAVSCASCHLQNKAFSDGVPLGSEGVSGETLGRHAPVLQNLAWHDRGLFWDGGASDLESLVVAPLEHPDEMASDPADVIERLHNDPSYVAAFAAAFTAPPNMAYLMRAVAQFLRTLVSGASRYDAYRAGEIVLSDVEMRGLSVFERACSSCHPPPFFTDHDFHNLGLEAEFSDDPEDLRKGRGRITEERADFGKFKTPSLRNLHVSKPYLHDGRFGTLREVLERYRDGLPDRAALDPLLRNAQGRAGLDLSDQELDDLEVFLVALEDPAFLTNEAFAQP